MRAPFRPLHRQRRQPKPPGGKHQAPGAEHPSADVRPCPSHAGVRPPQGGPGASSAPRDTWESFLATSGVHAPTSNTQRRQRVVAKNRLAGTRAKNNRGRDAPSRVLPRLFPQITVERLNAAGKKLSGRAARPVPRRRQSSASSSRWRRLRVPVLGRSEPCSGPCTTVQLTAQRPGCSIGTPMRHRADGMEAQGHSADGHRRGRAAARESGHPSEPYCQCRIEGD